MPVRFRRFALTAVAALAAVTVAALPSNLTGAAPSPEPTTVSTSDEATGELLGYRPLARPGRILDTREGGVTVDGTGAGNGLTAGGSTVQVSVRNRAGVAADATVVMLNVTVTGPSAPGYVTVWPCGEDQPNSSNLNFAAGQTIANQVVSAVGSGGRVCVFTSAPTHMLVDISGSYGDFAGVTMLPAPARIADTRPGAFTFDGESEAAGLIGAGEVLRVRIHNRAGMYDDTTMAILNVTATDTRGPGYLTVYPCTATPPNASNVNFEAGTTIANSVLAGVSSRGEVCVFTSAPTHLIVDVSGFSTTNAPIDSRPNLLASPARILDTRPGGSTVDRERAGDGFLGADGVVALEVAGRAGIPVDASTVLLNVTATGPTAGGYLTVHPCGATRPNASNVNFSPGQTIAGSVLAGVGVDGKVSLYTSAGTHLLVDVAGWIDPAPGQAPVTASAPCSDVRRSALAGDGKARVEVTQRSSDRTSFRIHDTSGRNLTAATAQPARTLATRTIYVTAVHSDQDAGQGAGASLKVLRVIGNYRSGEVPPGCQDAVVATGEVMVCVGFPLMDQTDPSNFTWADIPNHPGDIARVLDAVLDDPDLLGGFEPDALVYEGGSMGAITGFYLLHPDGRESRFDAIIATAGMAPPWIPAFSDPAVWAEAPPVLMINTLDDTIIPYELARTTYTNAGSSRLTLVTGTIGGHQNPQSCSSIGSFRQAWTDHVLGRGDTPDEAALTAAGCAALGVLPGGTTGYGTAAALAP